ncbi:hypothetical protein [Pseudomonas indica]|nr:hypothetical protein [Pseudomonas indica]
MSSFLEAMPQAGQQPDARHCHESGLTLSRKGTKEQMFLGFTPKVFLPE